MSTRNKPRIWIASDDTGKTERLVRAIHQSAALRHVFSARVASQDDLERLITKGVRVENALPEAPGLQAELPET